MADVNVTELTNLLEQAQAFGVDYTRAISYRSGDLEVENAEALKELIGLIELRRKERDRQPASRWLSTRKGGRGRLGV